MNGHAAPLVCLVAGGTAGHLFPAEALSVALAARGVAVALVTDRRGLRYGERFPAVSRHAVASDTFRSRNPLAAIAAAARIARGLFGSYVLLGRLQPRAVIGFGGYPTLPPLLAATLRRIPTLIHEQNAVLGRANRLLAPLVDAIATGFPGTLAQHRRLTAKAIVTGNPVRPAVIAAAGKPYSAPQPDGALRILVFGGSQGARIMAEIVPAAIEKLDAGLRARLALTQQARAEDFARVRAAYRRINVAAEIAAFFDDLPSRMAAVHLIVCRGGASTIAELSVIGRPAIVVPLPHALDQDQSANAGVLEKAGGAIRLKQDDFTPDRLAAEIAALAGDPARLSRMAAAAKSAGVLDAADQLADLVMRVADVTPSHR